MENITAAELVDGMRIEHNGSKQQVDVYNVVKLAKGSVNWNGQLVNGDGTEHGFSAPDDFPLTLIRGGKQSIDITPQSLKTPEGAALVAAALKAWEYSTAEVARVAAVLLDEYDDGEDIKGAIRELREVIDIRSAAQDAFLRALAGRPEQVEQDISCKGCGASDVRNCRCEEEEDTDEVALRAEQMR